MCHPRPSIGPACWLAEARMRGQRLKRGTDWILDLNGQANQSSARNEIVGRLSNVDRVMMKKSGRACNEDEKICSCASESGNSVGKGLHMQPDICNALQNHHTNTHPSPNRACCLHLDYDRCAIGQAVAPKVYPKSSRPDPPCLPIVPQHRANCLS